MRKLIAGINMTLDGYCDHTSITPDDEIHHHYKEVLKNSDAVLYGRITYQLMESYWPTVVKNPTGNQSADEFAIAMENISKIVFSHTMKKVNWESARLAKGSLKEEVSALKQQPGRDILVGSPSLIIESLKLNLVDEFQLLVHPVVVGSGLPLFKNITERLSFKLLKTKTFNAGSILYYYEPVSK